MKEVFQSIGRVFGRLENFNVLLGAFLFVALFTVLYYFFFKFLRENEPEQYAQVVGVDELLRDKNPKPPMDSDLFISRSRKRLMDLTDEDCNDAECFEYCGKQIWNGF